MQHLSVAKHKRLYHSGVQTQHQCDLCPLSDNSFREFEKTQKENSS